MEIEKVKVTVIHMWCGPRCLSTATMYSFAQRPDICKVLDEPLYASWLQRNQNVFRPYRSEMEDLLKRDISRFGCDDPVKLLQAEIKSTCKNRRKESSTVIFLKHIAKQVDQIDITEILSAQQSDLIGNDGTVYEVNYKHFIMLRNPLPMILSWQKKKDENVHDESCSLSTMGLPKLVEIYSELRRLHPLGQPPVVIDSATLARDPEGTLQILCDRLQIEFYPEQLQWEAGPKPEIDGLWASYWYQQVHKSTGFHTSPNDCPESNHVNNMPAALSPDEVELYREALPFFDLLTRRAIGREPLNPGSSPAASSSNSSSTGTVLDHGLRMQLSCTLSDARNEHVLVWVGDRLLPRELAKVSVFDSAVQGGDAVWEGLRVYKGTVFMLEQHIQRLLDSSKAMAFANVPSRAFIKQAVFSTLAANGMQDGVHMRLTLTRGAKLTSSMNPAFNVFGCNLIVLPEWKPVGDAATYDNSRGIRLITATNRRNSPQCVDSKIHHCNLINNILPKIQANVGGAADALMLDLEGFVSETNATNVFMVKNGVVITPHADYCLPGVTRHTVMTLVREELGLLMVERRVSLAEFHAADEVFTTGTMGELTPVYEIDGRAIGPSEGPVGAGSGPITRRIQDAYRDLTAKIGYPLPRV